MKWDLYQPGDGDLIDTDNNNNNNETGQFIDATTGQTVNTEGKINCTSYVLYSCTENSFN